MYTSLLAMLALIALVCTGCVHQSQRHPLQLHPENPHYFLFRGRPTILITSGEHYGAVLNADFDFVRYLNTLAKDRLNHTRMWVGAYCEYPGALSISGNTLAPAAGRFICPWARSDQPGYAGGGNRFDLSRFDEAYFHRLRRFVSHASERGIVVELNLFCPFYQDQMWAFSPMNAQNNVNGLGGVGRDDVYTLDKHGGLLPIQEAMVRKVVAELRDFDNIYLEVMNEPYVCNVPMDWQRHMIDVIAAAQRDVGSRHLISVNVANEKGKVQDPHPAVSIYNFHYAWPPDAVAMNYDLRAVIGENETGGRQQHDFYYRREGWAFILAGGGLYSNLDYSFAVGHEDGTFVYPRAQPGGGSAALRRQLGILSDFIHGFDFVRMSPDPQVVHDLNPGNDMAAYALVEPGRQYAIYFCRLGQESPTEPTTVVFSLDLPGGRYRIDWINTLNGEVEQQEQVEHAGGARPMSSPRFVGDIALRVVARQ
ncbi:hypothetical protein [Fontivita pretiosa]|uniref:hypothetical protein n=1 Tax=Fontivita pretiosa TaxID=2989684 RepID=UPI003D174E4D